MIPGLFDLIGGIFKPAVNLIDELHTSDEEKMAARAKLDIIKNAALAKAQEYDIVLAKAQRDVIVAEATSEGMLARNWRPGIMVLFGVIIANNYILNPWISAMFDVNVMMDIPEHMWQLLKIGLGGYVVSRGVEKTMKEYKK